MKKNENPKEIWDSAYMGLFDDGTIGISDGSGFIGGIEKEEVKELYEALKKYFNQERKS